MPQVNSSSPLFALKIAVRWRAGGTPRPAVVRSRTLVTKIGRAKEPLVLTYSRSLSPSPTTGKPTAIATTNHRQPVPGTPYFGERNRSVDALIDFPYFYR
jgi:hypothetical protein